MTDQIPVTMNTILCKMFGLSESQLRSRAKYASKSTVTKWASLPGFPRPIRPPTAGRGLGHPLYLPAEVRKWAMSHKDGATGRVGRPRNNTGA